MHNFGSLYKTELKKILFVFQKFFHFRAHSLKQCIIQFLTCDFFAGLFLLLVKLIR